MDDKFDSLRQAVAAFHDPGAGTTDTLLQFRNAANLNTIQALLSEYYRIREMLTDVAAVHSIGVLDAQELALVRDFRACDAHGQKMMAISGRVAVTSSAESAALPRCEVVSIVKRSE